MIHAVKRFLKNDHKTSLQRLLERLLGRPANPDPYLPKARLEYMVVEYTDRTTIGTMHSKRRTLRDG